jgi:drug/metabolite transporter (DMT)-like permease
MGVSFSLIIFGLLSALSWGGGDFSGGLATKRSPVYSVIITAQSLGLLMLLAVAVGIRETFPPVEHLFFGVLAGLTGTVGIVCLYSALANSRMGLAAPVSAIVAAGLPVLVGAFTLGLPSGVNLVGLLLALLSIWLVSRTEGEHEPFKLNMLYLPGLAGLGFGLFFVLIDRANDVAVFYPLAAARIASLSLLLAFALGTKKAVLTERSQWPLIALCGFLDTWGNIFYAMAAQAGRADIAAVLSSMYPAGTILLARLLLKERIGRVQWLGIGLALVAVAMISWHPIN